MARTDEAHLAGPPVDVDRAEVRRAVDGAQAVAARHRVAGKGHVEAARGDLVERVGHARSAIERADVAVARDEDHPARPRSRRSGRTASPLARQVAPALPAVALGQHLDRGDDQAQLGRLRSRSRQPGPLRLAEHRLGRVGVGQVALLAGRAALLGRASAASGNSACRAGSPGPACPGAKDLGMIDALAVRRGSSAGHLPELAGTAAWPAALSGKSAPPSFWP